MRGRRIAAEQRAGQAQPLKSLTHTREAPGLEVERGELHCCLLKNVRALAARSRAGIKHPLTVLDIKPQRGALGPLVLHRHQSLGPARKPLHRPGGFDDDRSRTHHSAGVPVGLKAHHIVGERDAAAVDSECERRMAVRRLGDRLPGVGVIGPQHLEPPLRVIPARLGVAPCRIQPRRGRA